MHEKPEGRPVIVSAHIDEKDRTVNKSLRRLLAGLALTAAAATGTLTAATTASADPAPTDTTWGTPAPTDTPADTTWGVAPTGQDNGAGITVTPLDTTWG